MSSKTGSLLILFLTLFPQDVWIYDVKSRGGLDGPSVGYGITLVAETMKGFYKGTDLVVDAEIQNKLGMLRSSTEQKACGALLLNKKLGIGEILEKEESKSCKETSSLGMI